MGNQDCSAWTTPGTIEHILPESYPRQWEWTAEDHAAFVYKIGNYCLLEPKLNSRYAGDAPFSHKQQVYTESQYKTALHAAEAYGEWTKEIIASRQRNMAKMAASIWKINY